MKLYATSIPQALPSWATVVSNKADLIEVEINDKDPSFTNSRSNYSMKNIGIKPIHPKEFKRVHNFSTYQMSRLSGYSVEALKNWLADESSSRFVEPKPYVLNHFGAIHSYLLRS